MAGHEEFQLFDQCRVCIVCSKDLSLDAAHQVCDISVDLPSSQVP